MRSLSEFMKPALITGLLLLISSCEKPEGLLDPLDSESWEVNNTSNSGLQGNDIRDITMDSNGNLWFACYGSGISKYDGQKWTVYNELNSPLASDYVEVIMENMNGDMWFGGYSGISMLADGNDWDFFNDTDYGGTYVNALFMDSENRIWVGTEGTGFYIYEDGVFDGPYVYDYYDGYYYVNDFTEDSEGNIWMGTDTNIVVFSGNSQIPFYVFDSYPVINKLYTDSKGRVWVAADGGETVSYYQDGYFRYISLYTGGTNYFVYDIIEDKQNNIWFATYLDGLILYDGIINRSYKPYNGFPSEWNDCLEVDREGSIWIGTLELGAIRFNPPVKY